MAFSISMLPSRSCRILRGRQGLSILSALLLLQAANTERSADEQEGSEDFRQADTATSAMVPNPMSAFGSSPAAIANAQKQEDADAQICRDLLQQFDTRYIHSSYKKQLVQALSKPGCKPVFQEWGLDPEATYKSSTFQAMREKATSSPADDHLQDGGLMAMWDLLLRKQDKDETQNPANIEKADLEERKNFFPWASREKQDVTYNENDPQTVVPPQSWSSTDESLNYDRVRQFADSRIQPIKDWALNVRNLETKADEVVAAASAADQLGKDEVNVMKMVNAKRQVALKKAREEKLSELITLNRAVKEQNSPNFKQLEEKVTSKMRSATSSFPLEANQVDVESGAKRTDDRVIANMKWIKPLNDERFVSRLKPGDE